MIKLTGVMRNNNVTRVVTIYSKNLARAIEKIERRIQLRNFKDGVLLKPRGESHATIVREKRIQIAIKNLVKKKILDEKLLSEKNISVYINPKDWGLSEVLQKSKGLPFTKEIPKNLDIKKAALRTNKRGRYFIDISSKKLNEITKKETIRCLINRRENIILVKSKELSARKLTPHGKGRIQIAIPKEIMKKEEILKLSKKSWLPINIELNLDSFGLSLPDFFSVKEEKELAECLTKKKIKIKLKDYTDPYDIYLPKQGIGIEIHNSLPLKGDLTTRHSIKSGMIRLRILEASFLVNNKELREFYLILNKNWERGKYVKELSEKNEKNVRILYTYFNKGWERVIVSKIISSSIQTGI